MAYKRARKYLKEIEHPIAQNQLEVIEMDKHDKSYAQKVLRDWISEDKDLFQVDSNYEPTKKQKKHQIMIKIEKMLGIDLSKKHYKLI